MDQIASDRIDHTTEYISSEYEQVCTEIENFDHVTKRLNINSDLLEFFEKQRYSSPLLFEISILVHGVPATQTSVERAFSALHFVLNELRYNMLESTLEKVVLLKLNKLA